MAKERRVVETKLLKDEAYKKCFKRATQLELNIKVNIAGERLEVEKKKRTALWWVCVIIGFCFYIIPGVLLLAFWKPVWYCKLIFNDSEEGSTVIAQVKDEDGIQFFNEISGLLI